ncbi:MULTISPECIES: hypothetical protein [Parabacteroides]|uniref:Uncharacterized protein n=1 Tax=Parabacteroides chinchillae TaxID=871327 RepID=A0A8G2BUS2_9BACT|nr:MULTISPECIES: hypothetical protein [Parabacteroides]SEF60852.1 hypothetical protein SAMN05444001_103115 [Parabacteroides chinchillae]
MNSNNAKIQSVIESAFSTAINKLAKDESGSFISDLYVQADAESGELQIYDDEEHLIEKIVIFDWVNNTEEEDVFNKRVAASVKAVLTILSTKDMFNHPRFMKPLSISLTDEDFVVIEELLFLDDETLRLDDPLLKDLDADLDDFLAKLLSDVD